MQIGSPICDQWQTHLAGTGRAALYARPHSLQRPTRGRRVALLAAKWLIARAAAQCDAGGRRQRASSNGAESASGSRLGRVRSAG